MSAEKQKYVLALFQNLKYVDDMIFYYIIIVMNALHALVVIR
jgi:hypothetical protein